MNRHTGGDLILDPSARFLRIDYTCPCEPEWTHGQTGARARDRNREVAGLLLAMRRLRQKRMVVMRLGEAE
jgi:hypothetical protein